MSRCASSSVCAATPASSCSVALVKPGEARVATCRALGQPSIHQVQRDGLGMTGMDQVRPELGLEQQTQAGAKVRQEARDRQRQVVGQVAARYRVAEHLLAGGTACRRHVRQEQAMVGPTLPQRLYQRLGGSGLADRHSMQPDHRRRGGRSDRSRTAPGHAADMPAGDDYAIADAAMQTGRADAAATYRHRAKDSWAHRAVCGSGGRRHAEITEATGRAVLASDVHRARRAV